MHEFPYKTWLCAAIMLLMPWVAHAAGLGKLNVLSALGQPLLAEIELLSLQKDELPTLTARIASPDAFQLANITYSTALIGARLSIERRTDGRSYIKVISLRPINEPFLDVLIELSWAQGRLVREYTALIDPPGYSPSTAAAAVAPVVPPVTTQAAPPVTVAPVQQPAEVAATAPSPKAPVAQAPASPRPAPAAKSGAGEYAVKRGDTLVKIAASTKPEGVTLDQMLVSLYRSNPDAFADNMNRLKTGKILRVPEQTSIAETAQADAAKEVRVQAANWNAYRMKLADSAGAAPAQATGKAASGKIVTAEDKAAGKEAPKEVLKLSKGDTSVAGKAGTGKPASPKDRVRMLEEEATAREKSLAEANERVTQLEKNIKDMQRLLEMKGVVPGAKPAVPAVPPATGDQAKAAAAKSEPPKVEPVTKAAPAKAEPPKADVAAAPGKDAAKAPAEAPKADQKAPPPPPKADGEPPKADVAKGDATKPEQAASPKPKPKVVVPPPPPPEPELIDQVISAASDPVYLGGGLGGLAILGGGAYWLARRRRKQAEGDERGGVKTAPTIRKAAAAPAAAAPPAAAEVPPATPVDDVDPLAEADLYLNFGRDAQAEEVLKEALEKNPRHEEAQIKLLQIYAGRKDKVEFEKVASKLNAQTAGAGENWLKAAAMGYAFDPENSLYAAGKSAPTPAAPAAGGAAPSTDLDFDLELAPGASVTATDVPLEGGVAEKTMMMEPGVLSAMAESPQADPTATQDITRDSALRATRAAQAAAPDFTLGEQSSVGTETDILLDAGPNQGAEGGEPAPMANVIDFNFDATTVLDTPAAPADPGLDRTLIITPEHQAKAADLGMDFDIGDAPAEEPAKAADATTVLPLDSEFKLDLPGEAPAAPLAPEFKFDDINLTLDDAPSAEAAAPAGGGAKDDHWYDVQTKFDLAKAYQEMGDKDGAREILQEVIKEGDAAQQAEAKQLLDSLG